MVRLDRATSTQPFAVEQAQLIPGFKFSTAEAKALGEIGGVISELGRRKIDMQDRIGTAKANGLRRQAEDQYLLEIQDKPLEQHAAIRTKIINEAKTTAGQLRMSSKAREISDAEFDIWDDNFNTRSELINLKAVETEATILLSDEYGAALTNAKGDLTDPDFVKAELALDEHLESAMEPGERKRFKGKLNDDAVKQIKENAIREQKNIAVANPAQTTKKITDELKLRSKGKMSPEFEMFSNSELESIRDYANTIGEKQKTQSELNLNAALVDGYGEIRDNDAIDIDALIDRNNLDPAQSNEDKIKFAEKIPTYFNKINSTEEAEESDNNVYDELTQATELEERGAMSPSDFEELYADKKGKLTTEDQRLIRSKDIVATKTMQNRAFSDAMVTERATFIEATEDTIGAIKLARRNAEAVRDIPGINLFNIALKKNQAQQWNFGRYRNLLREQLNQNPEWSAKQIATAKDILIDQLDVTDDKLLRAFDEQNPNRAIMKTAPDPVFEDIWGDLSIEDKSLIWSGRMKGIPVEVLLESQEAIEAK